MVQVDLAELRQVWYLMGLNGTAITGERKVLYNSLDSWQRQELRNEYLKGANDCIDAW